MAPASVLLGLGWFSHRILKCDRCDQAEIVPEVYAQRFQPLKGRLSWRPFSFWIKFKLLKNSAEITFIFF
jgi:hypothetical protein